MSINDYVLLERSKNRNYIQIINGLLQSEGIKSVILSKQDSVYAFDAFPGYQEIHIPRAQYEKSRAILREGKETEEEE